MKKRKHVFSTCLSVFLALLLVLPMLPVPVWSVNNVTPEGLRYTVTSWWVGGDCVIITGHEGQPSEIVIPAEIDGLPVKSIGAYAFSSRQNLTKVTLPDTIEEIGDGAFRNCINLTQINFPEGLTTINEGAFQDCTGLTRIDLPDSLNLIINSGFRGCTGLTSVTIPCGIGPMAFADCTSLERVDIRGSFMWAAFSGCTSLKEVILPDGLTEIDFDAFANCTSLTEITIPDSVESINMYAFSGCAALETVNLGSGLAHIGDGVFDGCTSLTELYIPASVSEIASTAFDGCVNLERLIIDENSPYLSFADRILYNRDRTEIILFLPGELGHVTIPEGVTRIGDDLFRNRTDLTGITLPTTLREIGNGAFYCCTGLTEITIPEGVTSIGEYAFHGCTGMADLRIPDSTTVIGSSAFEKCTGLTAVQLGSGLTEIGYSAFYDCTALTDISIPKSVTFIGNNVFYGCNVLEEIQVDPDNADYRSEDGILYSMDLSTLLLCPAGKEGSVDVPSGVTTIAQSAFAKCGGVTAVTIPDTVTAIQADAFRECSGLTEIAIPNSVTNLGDWTFLSCSSLTKATLPDTLYTIPEGLFSNCTSLENITLPDTVRTINGSAFNGCSGLKQIDFPDNLSSIYWSAFENCTSLENVFIPKYVSLLGGAAFRGCTSLEEFRVDPDNGYYTAIDGVLYTRDLSRLLACPAGKQGTVAIPEGVTEVTEGAFYCCTGVTGVHIPSTIQDSYALQGYSGNPFRDCTGLKTFTVAQNHLFFSVEGGALLAEGGTVLCALPGAYTGTYTVGRDITFVEPNAFSACRDLTGILVEEGNSTFSSVDGVLFNSNGSVLLRYPYGKGGSYTVPDGVMEINGYAFYNCDALRDITLSSSVTDIWELAFYGCKNLTDVYYSGTEDQWKAVRVYAENEDLENATFHFWNCPAGPEHTLDEVVVIISPTCTVDGEEERSCSHCDYSENRTVAATGHSHEAVVTAPTCTEDGYTTYTCSCGDTYIDAAVPALGHDLSGWEITKDPTCTAEGEEERACSRCDYAETKSIAATGHSYEAVVTAPTCTEEGYTTYTCDCGDTYVDAAVPALGHDLSGWEVSKAPTCTAEGEEERSCSRCDYAETKSIAATGHSYEAVVTAPTCTEDGYTTYTCDCGDTYVDVAVPALGHDLSGWEVSKAPSCTAEGEEERSCSRCDYAETKSIAATGHSYEAVVTAPTCTEDGYTTYTCDCGDTYVDAPVSALGHNWVDNQCTSCGAVRENPFGDVKQNDYFLNPVLWAVEKGITAGTGNGNFSPNNTCTRGQVVTFLWRAVGQPEPMTKENPFTDVQESDYFYKAVLWAKEAGVTSGKNATLFAPNEPCTRDQVVTFLWRALGKPAPKQQDNPFTDVATGLYYYEPVLWAMENGITSGTSATTFAPSNPCTRGQVVTFLYRALNGK